MDNSNNQTPKSEAQTTKVAPVQAAPASTPVKKKTGLIVGIAAAILVVAATIIVLMLTVFAGPSKADYAKMLEASKDARSAYVDLKSSFSALSRLTTSGTLSTTAPDTKYDDANEALDKFKEVQADFKDQKALNDREVKDAYQEYDEKQQKFVEYSQVFFESHRAVAKASIDCNKAITNNGSLVRQNAADESTVTKFNASIADCKKLLSSAKEVKNQPLNRLAKAMDKYVSALQSSVVKNVEANKSKSRSAYYESQKSVQEAADEYTKEVLSLSKQIVEESKDVEVSERLNALGALLADKAEGN